MGYPRLVASDLKFKYVREVGTSDQYLWDNDWLCGLGIGIQHKDWNGEKLLVVASCAVACACTPRGEPASKKCSTSTTTDSHSFDLQLNAKINTSYCRWFGLYKQLLKSIVNVSDCSYIKIKL